MSAGFQVIREKNRFIIQQRTLLQVEVLDAQRVFNKGSVVQNLAVSSSSLRIEQLIK